MPNPKQTTSSDCNDAQTTDCSSRKPREHEETQGGDIPKLCPPNIPSLSTILFYFYIANSPQIHSISELMVTANEVSKMTIAHEIVVNHDFKLQEVNLSPNSIDGTEKEYLSRGEKLYETWPPDNITLLSLLLPRQTRLKSQIEEALDIELIKQEAEHGALDIPNLTTYILGTMAMLCAPIRDEEIQSLRIMADPVHLLREIFRVLNLMKMDMANFTIQSLRPHLLEHSVQYERKKFQELLNKLPGNYYSLDYTTDWLRRAVTEVSNSDLLPSSSTSGTKGPPVSTCPMSTGKVSFIHSPTAVLNQAYMDLLDWELGREQYPEVRLVNKATYKTRIDQANIHSTLFMESV
ncbi:hypothetical protein Chor_003850 [Crotalus horridus]